MALKPIALRFIRCVGGLAAISLALTLRAAPTALAPSAGQTVSLLSERQRAYLSLDDTRLRAALRAKDAKYVKAHPASANDRFAVEATPQPVVLTWTGGGGVCTVRVVRTPENETVAAGTSSDGAFRVYNLEAGRTYRWTVRDADGEASATFATAPGAPRILNGGAVPHVRDLGGWTGLDGRRIVQGRIFRSAEMNRQITQKVIDRAKKRGVKGLVLGEYLNYITVTNRAVFTDVMKVRTDVDLRYTNEVAGLVHSPIGPDVKWLNCPISPYYKPSKQQMGSLTAILDPQNHPVVFHCAAGKDRTGTVAAFVLGLLGVSETDILRDYGLIDERLNMQRFEALISSLKTTYRAATFAAACEAHIRKLGFSDADIVRFREAMLER